MGDWEDKVEKDVNAGVLHHIAVEILKREEFPYNGCGAIKIVYPVYPFWLKKTDPGRKKPLVDSVREYRSAKRKFFDDITGILDNIKIRVVGSALMQPMCALNKTLFIRPYYVDAKYGLNATTNVLGDTLESTSTGMPNFRPDGSLDKGSGLGNGTGAWIEVSPEVWTGVRGKGGPGLEPDEVVYHEMVHAFRMMTGTIYRMPVNQGYENEEEFLAIVLTNIYMSEKKAPALRARHQPPNTALFEPDKFLDNSQNVNLPPIYLIERFRLNNPMLYAKFAAITKTSAAFNPVREFEVRRAAGAIKFK
jgi:hypothetical protein